MYRANWFGVRCFERQRGRKVWSVDNNVILCSAIETCITWFSSQCLSCCDKSHKRPILQFEHR